MNNNEEHIEQEEHWVSVSDLMTDDGVSADCHCVYG